MKKLILAMAIVASAFAFGQKKDAAALNAQLQEAKKIAESFLSNGVIEDVVEVSIEQD